jgi:hypothetical protein
MHVSFTSYTALKCTMNNFAVRSSTKKRVYVEECDKKKTKFAKGELECIDCGKCVFARTGKQRVWHFCHFSEKDGKLCSSTNGGETKEHYEAKHFISKNIHKCAFATEICPTCSKAEYFVAKVNGNPVAFQDCKTEVEMKVKGSSRIVDVGVTHKNSGLVVAAIEIFHTHQVDYQKETELKVLGIPVLEVTTRTTQPFQKINAHSGSSELWVLKTTGTKSIECSSCFQDRLKKEINDGMFQSYTADHSTIQAYNRWYDHEWCCHANDLWEAWQEITFKQRAKSLRIQGIRTAMRLLEGCENNSQQNQIKTNAKFIGKCPACNKWMRDGVDLCIIWAGTMGKKQWDTLFLDRPEKYRKQYRDDAGELQDITVHSCCSMECNGCHECCLLGQIAQYGLCLQCNLRAS